MARHHLLNLTSSDQRLAMLWSSLSRTFSDSRVPRTLQSPTLTRSIWSGAKVSGAAMTSASSGKGGSEADFIRALDKYSNYQPTPVSIQHFIDFAENANAVSSFLFLKRELPVRLANIMKELQLLPAELHETKACKVRFLWIMLDIVIVLTMSFQTVVDEYAQSFKDVLSFESQDHNDHKVLNDFTDMLHKVKLWKPEVSDIDIDENILTILGPG